MHVHIALANSSDGLARAARLRQTRTGDRDSLNGLMAEHDRATTGRSAAAGLERPTFRRGSASRSRRFVACHSGLCPPAGGSFLRLRLALYVGLFRTLKLYTGNHTAAPPHRPCDKKVGYWADVPISQYP
jgi:hypothetical protein